MLLPFQQNTKDLSASSRFIFQYNIRSYPTTILYNNSIPHQFTGHHTAADLVEFVEVSTVLTYKFSKLVSIHFVK